MKIRTDFVTNSSSSSFVLEISIELTNGKEVHFHGTGCDVDAGISGDFYDLQARVSPRELGMANSVAELVALLKNGIVDCDNRENPIKIMDEDDPRRKAELAEAKAKQWGIVAQYGAASVFIHQVENIPDINTVKRVKISGKEYNYMKYLRTYTYDRRTGDYYVWIKGGFIDKDGGSGGDLVFSDEDLAVNQDHLWKKYLDRDLNFLNFKNRIFITRGFSKKENQEIECAIKKRGGSMLGNSYLGDINEAVYCLIVSDNLEKAWASDVTRLRENIRYAWGIHVIRYKTFLRFLDLPEGALLKPNLPPYRLLKGKDSEIVYLTDVSASVSELDLSGFSYFIIRERAFASCFNLKKLRLPLCRMENGCFGDNLRFQVEFPILSIGKCKDTYTKRVLIQTFLQKWANGEPVDPLLRVEYDSYLRSQRKRFLDDDNAVRYLATNGMLQKEEAQTLAQEARKEGKSDLAELLENALPTKKVKSTTPAMDKLWSTTKLPNGTLKLRLYKGLEEDVVVPSFLKGLSVTEVDSEVFSISDKKLSEDQKNARAKIRSLTIQEGITFLGKEADSEIQMNRSVWMLENLSNLKRISFPDGLVESSGLKGVPADAEIICSPGYYGVKSAFEEASFDSITVLPAATSIGEKAFYNCKNLRSIKLPESLQTICDESFYNCVSLETIVIPPEVTTIGKNAFRGCNGLYSVKLPEKLTMIDEGAFRECENLTSISIPANTISIERMAFYACKNLQSVTLSENLQKIGDNAFLGCEKLEAITIPAKVTYIAPWSFHGCRSLRSIVFSEGLIKIDQLAFSACDNLNSVTIPRSVTSIQSNSFGKNVRIFAYSGSFAEQFAKLYNYDLTVLDSPDDSQIPTADLEKRNEDLQETVCEAKEKNESAQITEKNDSSQQPTAISENKADRIAKLSVNSDWMRGKIFVFTGFDDEKEARYVNIITQAGGTVKSSTVLATDYLIYNPYYGRETTKLSRARELIGRGKPITILTEQEFLQIEREKT